MTGEPKAESGGTGVDLPRPRTDPVVGERVARASGRSDALDGLRAVAAIIVVGFHSKLAGFQGGYIGVDIFFVLSGFLITRLLVTEFRDTGGIRYRSFVIRRAARLGPALFGLLIPLFLIAYAWPDSALRAVLVRDIIASALYVSNYTAAFRGYPDLLVHTWSLSVEQQFYLLWPGVVLLLCAPTRVSSAAFVLWSLYLACSAWRIYDILEFGDFARTYYRLDTRASGLVLGAVFAVSTPRFSDRGALMLSIACAVFLVYATVLNTWKTEFALLWHMTAVELAAAVLIAILVTRDGWADKVLSAKPLVQLGTISYGIYLWHYPVVRLLRPHLEPLEVFVIASAASVLAAAVSWKYLERPIMRRVSKSRST